jgi:hypothetical protein
MKNRVVLRDDFKATAVIAAIRTPWRAFSYRNAYDEFWHKDEIDNPIYAEEALIKGEVNIVKGIFGKEINTDFIRKYFSAGIPGDTARTYGTAKIKFYGSADRQSDYSQPEESVYLYLFMHEMTHIWQNQRGMMRHVYNMLRHPARDHRYELSPQSRFKDFGVEQQADIIGEYAMVFLGHNYSFDIGCDKALLQKVVEDRFPEARKTRVALEAWRNSPQKSAPKMR